MCSKGCVCVARDVCVVLPERIHVCVCDVCSYHINYGYISLISLL